MSGFIRALPLWQRAGVLAFVFLAATSAVILTTTRHRIFAHVGHGDEEIGEFDLDAPRTLTPETAKHIGLKVAAVETQNLEEVLEITGVVKPHPDRHRSVVPRVAGKLVRLTKQVGDTVKSGEVLAVIDSPELARSLYEVRKLGVDIEKVLLDAERRESDAKRFQAEIEGLRQQLELAKRDAQRMAALAGEGVSRKEAESRQADVAKLNGEMLAKQVEVDVAKREAEAQRRQAEALRLSRVAMLSIHNIDPHGGTAENPAVGSALEIRAEMDGVIVRRDALVGNWVEAGTSLLNIADYSSVQIEGELPESLISRVEGRSVNKVRIRPVASANGSDPLVEGQVKFIAPELESIKRTAHLVVEAPNPKGVLRGEMWVKLSIVLRESKSASVVPRTAVVLDGPVHFVFVETETGTVYQKQDINPGIMDDRFVEIKDGLFPGDIVVTQGAYSLTQLRPKAKAKAAGGAATAPAEPHTHAPDVAPHKH